MSTIPEMLKFANNSFEKAEEIAKDFIDKGNKGVILDLQLLLSAQGKFDEAKSWEVEADKYLADDKRRDFNKGWQKLRDGKFQEGMKLLYNSRQQRLFGSPALQTKKPMWNGKQDLKNKTIILFGEGGLGDEIINIRFARNIKDLGAKIVVAACSESLMDTFRRVDGVDLVINRNYSTTISHDYWVPCMSAPYFCNINYETLSGTKYMEPSNLEGWNCLLKSKDKLKVGIRWAGNPKFEHEQFRKFSTKHIFDLANVKNVQLYSFQRDNDLEKLPENIIDLAPLIQTWEDTSCALSKMDLVITSCTSIAHLSAAIGKTTWIIVPIMPYYLWAIDGNTSKWYNSVKLFRQTKFGNWEEPFKNITNELTNRSKLIFSN